MFNVLQIQDQLRNFSQEQLIQEMQAPSGNAPQYLVLSELNRRKKMQDDMKAREGQQNAQTTVAQDTVAAAGIPALKAQQMGQALAPKTDMAANTGVMSMQKSSPEPVQKMQRGGAVERDERTRIQVLARRRGLSPEAYMRQFGGPTMGEAPGYEDYPTFERPGTEAPPEDRYIPSPYLSQSSPDENIGIEPSTLDAQTYGPFQGVNQLENGDSLPVMPGYDAGPLADLGRFAPSPYMPTPSFDYEAPADAMPVSGVDDMMAEMNRMGIDPASTQDRDILAKTISAEAGGESLEGKIGVGAVIANRARLGNYGGTSIRDVIMKPGQFSAWNSVTGYAGGEGGLDMANRTPSDEDYRVADMILSGRYEDPTQGATHYYALQGMKDGKAPTWAAGRETLQIGNHTFLKADGAGADYQTRPEPPPPMPAYMPQMTPGGIFEGVLSSDEEGNPVADMSDSGAQRRADRHGSGDPKGISIPNFDPFGAFTGMFLPGGSDEPLPDEPTRPQARPPMQGPENMPQFGPPAPEVRPEDVPSDDEVSRSISDAEQQNAALEEARVSSTGAPPATSISDLIGQRMADLEEERENAKWMALANFGMALMADSSGSFLGNVGKSGIAAMEGYQENMQRVQATEDALLDAQIQQAVAAQDHQRAFELAKYRDSLQRASTRDRISAESAAELAGRQGIGALGWDADQNRQIEASVMDEKQVYEDAMARMDLVNDPEFYTEDGSDPAEARAEARRELVEAREAYNNAYAEAAARVAGVDISGNIVDLN